MASKSIYYRENENGNLESARLCRRKARDGGWCTNPSQAHRQAAGLDRRGLLRGALRCELRRLDAEGKRRGTIIWQIPNRRNWKKAWLMDILRENAHRCCEVSA